MPHVFEPAPSGRAKCRGCGQAIAKGELRFGERLPNPFAEGEMTHWFHVRCAALKRPEPFLEALPAADPAPGNAAALAAEARPGVEHRRLPRLDGAEVAPSGRARCRHCREVIDKGSWRLRLVFWEEGRFQPSGFVHATCAAEYLGTADVLDRIRHFTPLSEEDTTALRALGLGGA
jgi:Poly(ADP-ribose) polymerase and DNA-Ligase Zn-finger region